MKPREKIVGELKQVKSVKSNQRKSSKNTMFLTVGFDDGCCGEKKGCVIKTVGSQCIIDEVS